MQRTGRDLSILYSCLFVLALSTSIRVTQEWYKNEKQKREMEKEKLVSELSFLRSQVNPHFLFNTLNNIYSLSNRKSDKAPEAIQKTSIRASSLLSLDFSFIVYTEIIYSLFY